MILKNSINGKTILLQTDYSYKIQYEPIIDYTRLRETDQTDPKNDITSFQTQNSRNEKFLGTVTQTKFFQQFQTLLINTGSMKSILTPNITEKYFPQLNYSPTIRTPIKEKKNTFQGKIPSFFRI